MSNSPLSRVHPPACYFMPHDPSSAIHSDDEVTFGKLIADLEQWIGAVESGQCRMTVPKHA